MNSNTSALPTVTPIDDTTPPDILHASDKSPHKRYPKKAWIIAGSALIAFFLFTKVDLPITGTGYVTPSQQLVVEALEPGVVDKVFFSSGEAVEKGDVIAKLRNDELERKLTEARLEMHILRNKLTQIDRSRNYLRIMYTNYEQLYHEKVIARADFEKAKLEYTHAQREYDIARDETETLRGKMTYYMNALKKMEITAPLTGLIMTKLEDKVGRFLNKGDEIASIANVDTYLLRLSINEKNIGSLSVGSTASIHFPAFPRYKIRGKVEKIEHTAWEKVRKALVKENVINVFIRPNHYDLPARPGMTAAIKIHSLRVHRRW